MGIWPRKESNPSRNGEFVSSKTSQFWATACIQVPTLEVQAPNQSRRKSRYSKALKTRLSTVPALRKWLRACDQVQVVAVEVGKERQPVALILKRFADEVHLLCPKVGESFIEVIDIDARCRMPGSFSV